MSLILGGIAILGVLSIIGGIGMGIAKPEIRTLSFALAGLGLVMGSVCVGVFVLVVNSMN